VPASNAVVATPTTAPTTVSTRISSQWRRMVRRMRMSSMGATSSSGPDRPTLPGCGSGSVAGYLERVALPELSDQHRHVAGDPLGMGVIALGEDLSDAVDGPPGVEELPHVHPGARDRDGVLGVDGQQHD